MSGERDRETQSPQANAQTAIQVIGRTLQSILADLLGEIDDLRKIDYQLQPVVRKQIGRLAAELQRIADEIESGIFQATTNRRQETSTGKTTIAAKELKAKRVRKKSKGSLYKQLGGESVIGATVDGFYERVLSDDMLAPFFATANLIRQNG